MPPLERLLAALALIGLYVATVVFTVVYVALGMAQGVW